MTDTDTSLDGPDLTLGIPISTIADGTMVMGHVNGEQVVLARRGRVPEHTKIVFDLAVSAGIIR